jgi:hypothetical protein
MKGTLRHIRVLAAVFTITAAIVLNSMNRLVSVTAMFYVM